MADIFISYATADREVAAVLATKIASRGYTVWWDHHLVGGAQFRDVIHEQLNSSRVTIVIWTPSSVKSSWVKDEADEALRQSKLIPVRAKEIALSDIPLGHRSNHVIASNDIEEILRTLRARLGGSAGLTTELAIRKSTQAFAESTALGHVVS